MDNMTSACTWSEPERSDSERGGMPARTTTAVARQTTLDSVRPLSRLHSVATALPSAPRGEVSAAHLRYDPRSATTKSDIESLHAEYARLAELQVFGTISPVELRRMKYVGWQIDRIEMAELAPSFERLEQLVRLQEISARAMAELASAVQQVRRR